MNNGDETALGDKDYLKEYEINIEMLKHYDNLRQNKNTKFLTASTVLAAVLGLTVKDKTGDENFMLYAALPISFLGFIVCVLWFLLLARNAAYIDFHRSRINALEPLANPKFETFRL